MTKIPPFYENFDNTHCMQCALRGTLEFFEPETLWTWEKLDEFTHKLPNKWTWPERAQINMAKRGYEVIIIDKTSLQEYVDNGIYKTLLKVFGKEAADKQREMAPPFEALEKDMKACLASKSIEYKEQSPSIEGMKSLLFEGFLIISALNSRTLNDREGYSSHSVLVYKIDSKNVYFHDSGGPPGTPARQVSIDKFIEASTNPTDSQWSLVAYKKMKK